jgi:hypothetical protein
LLFAQCGKEADAGDRRQQGSVIGVLSGAVSMRADP